MAKVTLDVDLDARLWQSMSPAQQQEWVDEIVESVNDVAYVRGVEVRQ